MSIKYQSLKRYKYRLYETTQWQTKIKGYSINTDYIQISPNGLMIIREGYCWDGPSGISFDTPTFMKSSLFHDAGYQLIRMRLLPVIEKQIIDFLMKEINESVGMCDIRVTYTYEAVKQFGASSCIPGDIRAPKIIEAP